MFCLLHGHPFDLQQAQISLGPLDLSLDLLAILGVLVLRLNEKGPTPVTDSTTHQLGRVMVLHRLIFICQSMGEISL